MYYQKSYTIQEAKQELEAYCSYQDRCHFEVVQKLQQMNMIPSAVEQIVAQLISDEFLNETRFSKSFARGKFRIKKWGKIRIENELKIRQISQYNIRLALREIDEQEYLTTLDDLIKKRKAQISETHPLKVKKKIADYLFYRGWESHLVFDKINQLKL